MYLALIFAIQKLEHYLQHHHSKLIFKADLNGRLVKWAILLQQYDIEYDFQKGINWQALADLLAPHVPESLPLAIDLPDEKLY